jgi:hypothetical protein
MQVVKIDKVYVYPTRWEEVSTYIFCKFQNNLDDLIFAFAGVEKRIQQQIDVLDLSMILEDLKSLIKQDFTFQEKKIYSLPIRRMEWGKYEAAARFLKESVNFETLLKFINDYFGVDISQKPIQETFSTFEFYFKELNDFNIRYTSMAADENVSEKDKIIAGFGVLPVLNAIRGNEVWRDDEILKLPVGQIYDDLLYKNTKFRLNETI